MRILKNGWWYLLVMLAGITYNGLAGYFKVPLLWYFPMFFVWACLIWLLIGRVRRIFRF